MGVLVTLTRTPRERWPLIDPVGSTLPMTVATHWTFFSWTVIFLILIFFLARLRVLLAIRVLKLFGNEIAWVSSCIRHKKHLFIQKKEPYRLALPTPQMIFHFLLRLLFCTTHRIMNCKFSWPWVEKFIKGVKLLMSVSLHAQENCQSFIEFNDTEVINVDSCTQIQAIWVIEKLRVYGKQSTAYRDCLIL